MHTNSFPYYRSTRVHSLKNYVLGTFIGHKASAFHNAIIIFLGATMLLALRGSILHELLSVQLAPMHLRAGKGPSSTLNTCGLLDNF